MTWFSRQVYANSRMTKISWKRSVFGTCFVFIIVFIVMTKQGDYIPGSQTYDVCLFLPKGEKIQALFRSRN